MSDHSNDASKNVQHEIYKAQVNELEGLRESLTPEVSHEDVVKAIDQRIEQIDAAAVAEGHEAIW